MSEFDQDEPIIDGPEELEVPDELATLKARAAKVGLSFHPSIGLETLKEKYRKFMSDEAYEGDGDEQLSAAVSQIPSVSSLASTVEPVFTVAVPVEETKGQKQQRKRREASKLIRVVVTCLNPLKKEWEGEIISAGNLVVGTHKKFVPFNVEEGYHIPQILFNVLKERECQVFYTVGKERRAKMIKEFAVVTLPDLTAEELKSLAQRQAMANGTAA